MENETFWTLLKSIPHWEFEILLMVIFDFFLGVLIWPKVMKFLRHHDTDDEKIDRLERDVEMLKSKLL